MLLLLAALAATNPGMKTTSKLEMHGDFTYLLDCSGDTVSRPRKKLATSPSSMQAASRQAQKV